MQFLFENEKMLTEPENIKISIFIEEHVGLNEKGTLLE